MRTMQSNQLRGLMYDFGADLPPGRQAVIERLPEKLAGLDGVLPAMVIDTAREYLKQIKALQQDIVAIERRLTAWKKDDAASRRLMEIPGG
jgi:transposase